MTWTHTRSSNFPTVQMRTLANCRILKISFGVTSPTLLLADEPTDELDAQTAAQILALRRRLNQQMGLTVILVTHDLAIAAEMDRTIGPSRWLHQHRDGTLQSTYRRGWATSCWWQRGDWPIEQPPLSYPIPELAIYSLPPSLCRPHLSSAARRANDPARRDHRLTRHAVRQLSPCRWER